MTPLCGRCGRSAEGYAAIGGQRFCHSETRRCYEEQSWELTFCDAADRDGFLAALNEDNQQGEA